MSGKPLDVYFPNVNRDNSFNFSRVRYESVKQMQITADVHPKKGIMESKPFKSTIGEMVKDAKLVEPDAFWWI